MALELSPGAAVEASARSSSDAALARLVLDDGTRWEGQSFGAPVSSAGEVVFNTGMVGYPESLTDPSYCGQILVLTYPMIGNYGVPRLREHGGLDLAYESDRIQIAGLVVTEYSERHSHWDAFDSLAAWLKRDGVPAITGPDTRALTRRLRERGTMLGHIEYPGSPVVPFDPNAENLMPRVSIAAPRLYGKGTKRVVLVDTGGKNHIVHYLASCGVEVLRVPWDHDLSKEEFDGLFITNGPGDPTLCRATIDNLRKALDRKKPTFGICLGHQLLALAIGARTYKLKYGHRGQNQPVIEEGTKHCFITSQNHGFAVDTKSLPAGWEPWFTNLNDGTNEGIRHRDLPFLSVQFHPEAAPGPTDTQPLFKKFVGML